MVFSNTNGLLGWLAVLVKTMRVFGLEKTNNGEW